MNMPHEHEKRAASPFSRQRRNNTARGGCGFWIATCALACLLLLVNSAVAIGLYGALSAIAPDVFERPKLAQAVLLVVPVLMLVPEWRLIDWLGERIALRRKQ